MGKPSGVLLTIEGGGSKRRAALCWGGMTMARCLPKGLNPNDISRTVLRRRVESLVLPLLSLPGRPIGALHVLAALAGAGRPEPRGLCKDTIKAILRPRCSRLYLTVTSDAEALLEHFFAERDGMVLIAGTGSICLGVKHAGRVRVTARAGGWGSYFDSGCGFQLGLAVLQAALRRVDGRGDKSLMVDLLCRRSGLEIDRIPEQYLPVSRERVASLALIAVEAASLGDPAARKLVLEACKNLADLPQAVAGRLGLASSLELAISGGLFEDRYFRNSFRRILRRRLPSASIVQVTDPLACLIHLSRYFGDKKP
jgi:N-acetylglucosamine kinase-like BadF-type ATPase